MSTPSTRHYLLGLVIELERATDIDTRKALGWAQKALASYDKTAIQWEHKKVSRGKRVIERVNLEGEQGWQMAAMTDDYVLMKREVR